MHAIFFELSVMERKEERKKERKKEEEEEQNQYFRVSFSLLSCGLQERLGHF